MKAAHTLKTLFIDDCAIESPTDVSRRSNQPRKYVANPTLPIVPKGQSSWGADMPPRFASVIFDDDEKLSSESWLRNCIRGV